MTRKAEQLNTNSSTFKMCSECSVQKTLLEFYPKRYDYEACCKDCKKRKRHSKKNQSKRIELEKSQTLPEIVNQTTEIRTPAHRHSPSGPTSYPSQAPKEIAAAESNGSGGSTDAIDYTIWEGKCGKPLSEVERLEIKSTLTTFFTVFEEEYRRQNG